MVSCFFFLQDFFLWKYMRRAHLILCVFEGKCRGDIAQSGQLFRSKGLMLCVSYTGYHPDASIMFHDIDSSIPLRYHDKGWIECTAS